MYQRPNFAVDDSANWLEAGPRSLNMRNRMLCSAGRCLTVSDSITTALCLLSLRTLVQSSAAVLKRTRLPLLGDTQVMEETSTTDSRQNEVLAVATLFFVLSWLTTVFRFYVRGKLRHNWGADDSFMGATLLLFTIYLAFQTVTALYGTGQHRWNLKDSDARTALLVS